MENLQEYISDFFALDPATVSRVISSTLLIIVLSLIRLVVLRFVFRHTDDVRTRYNWRKTSTYVSVILGILIIGRIWFTGFQSVTTYLGIVSAGIAIALKDPLSNLAAWVFIVWRRPFTPGDRIEIGSVRGDVIDQRIFQFTVMEIGNWVDGDQSTGRVVRIPNGKVFTESLANYSKGFKFIWDEIQVLVTFESDWKKAKTILTKIAHARTEHLTKEAERRVQEASAKMMIFYKTLTPIALRLRLI
ncbi:mechanosensitive ion channel [bacterium AH-315-J21]|nr:mechanosensitive ion channel [bacterium AH-315-J21]